MSVEIKNDQELTDDYCQLIASELSLLERLLGGEMDTENAEEVEIVKTLAEQDDCDPLEYSANVVDYLNAYALEFKETGERDNGEWITTGFKILRTFGGPNCWITGDQTSYLQVETYWGSNVARLTVFAPYFASQIEDLNA